MGCRESYSHALISLEVHLAKYPDDLGALEMVGLGRMKSSDAAGAVECFERILAMQPDFERVLSSASLASERLGMDAKAIAYLERAIQVNPYSSQYRVTLGHLWMKQRKWERAMQAGEEALKLNPASLDARRLMVLLHGRQGHGPQALAAWQAFAGLDPPDKKNSGGWGPIRRAAGTNLPWRASRRKPDVFRSVHVGLTPRRSPG